MLNRFKIRVKQREFIRRLPVKQQTNKLQNILSINFKQYLCFDNCRTDIRQQETRTNMLIFYNTVITKVVCLSLVGTQFQTFFSPSELFSRNSRNGFLRCNPTNAYRFKTKWHHYLHNKLKNFETSGQSARCIEHHCDGCNQLLFE